MISIKSDSGYNIEISESSKSNKSSPYKESNSYDQNLVNELYEALRQEMDLIWD